MSDDAPSKTQLLLRRAEKALVSEGKSVLEDRRDLLAHLLVEQVRETEKLTADIDAALRRAAQLFRRCVMRHGAAGLTRFVAQPRSAAAGARVHNRLGVAFVEVDDPTDPADGEPPDGWAVSTELTATFTALQRLLPLLWTLAAHENNLQRLVAVFRRTQRRVNALEHVVLPDLQRSIRDMEDRMDEMERDDLVRALLIKRTAPGQPGGG